MLQASTSEVYGDPTVHPQPEEYRGNVSTTGPRACYDEGKRCAETLFFDYRRQNGVRIKVVRIFNTFGPRMHPDDGRVVSNFIMQALRGQDITLYGGGTQTRSFCFVDDLVDGLLRMMDSGEEVIGRPEGWGHQKAEDFTAHDYHQASDEPKLDWDLSGAAEDMQLLLAVGKRVATDAVWPAWKPGSEFKARREAQLREKP